MKQRIAITPMKIRDLKEPYTAFPKPLHTLEPSVDFQIMRILPIDSKTVCVQCYSPKNTSEYTYTVDTHPSDLEGLLFHQHDFFELMFVINGDVEEYIEGGHNIFSAYDACIMNRNTRHFELINQTETIYFCMSKNFVNNDYFLYSPLYSKKGELNSFFKGNLDGKSKKLKDYMAFFHKNDQCRSVVSELISSIIRELKNRYPGYISVIHGLTARLLSLLEHTDYYSHVYVNLSSGKESAIAGDIRHLLDAAKQRVTTEEISRQLNYNGDYLNRIFKKWYGMSMKDYCQQIYMKEALRLLMETDLSVIEIANRIGFVNPTHFYQIFRLYYDCTPNEYRMKR